MLFLCAWVYRRRRPNRFAMATPLSSRLSGTRRPETGNDAGQRRAGAAQRLRSAALAVERWGACAYQAASATTRPRTAAPATPGSPLVEISMKLKPALHFIQLRTVSGSRLVGGSHTPVCCLAGSSGISSFSAREGPPPLPACCEDSWVLGRSFLAALCRPSVTCQAAPIQVRRLSPAMRAVDLDVAEFGNSGRSPRPHGL